MSHETIRTIRARPWPSITLLGFAAITLCVIVFKQTGAWVVLGAILFCSAVVHIFCYSQINISADGLQLKNFYGEYSISWLQLKKTYVVYIRDGKASQYSWFFETTDQRKIKFSVQFYSHKSIVRLAKAIVSNASGAIADETIYAFAEDRYKWWPMTGL